MKRTVSKFVVLIGIACMVVILSVAVLILLSERFTDAGNYFVSKSSRSSGSTSGNNGYVTALEKMRDAYSTIKTVELEADVTIEIIKPTSNVTGTGKVRYIAQDNKYKYVSEISENLENEGLMRNVDILYDGTKFYFYDRESKIVSFQSSEETRLPNALPNPLFLPIEFLSNDDDSCEGCKMRLYDIKMPLRWAKRVSSISEISTDTNNGIIHSLIEMPGGDLNKIPYNYRVRLVGESVNNLQPVSVARTKENGNPLVEILLNDMRSVQGLTVKFPYIIEVGARDDNGAMAMKAKYTITQLKINQQFETNLLSPNFAGAEKFWDSDAKSFLEH